MRTGGLDMPWTEPSTPVKAYCDATRRGDNGPRSENELADMVADTHIRQTPEPLNQPKYGTTD